MQSPLPGQEPFFRAGVGALGAGSRLGLETSPVSNGGEDLLPASWHEPNDFPGRSSLASTRAQHVTRWYS